MKIFAMPRLSRALIAMALLAGLASPGSGAQPEPQRFGPGRAALVAAGSGTFKITSPEARVSIRFSASRDGALTRFGFAAFPGAGYASHEKDAFKVALHDDANGLPGRVLASATETRFNDGGARLRTALFSPGTQVAAGRTYHLVISCPQADSQARAFGVEYALMPRDGTALNSFDMDTPDAGRGFLTSADGGASWTQVAQAVGAHEIVIGGLPQGWAYTGTVEMPIKRGPAGIQYMMQTFRFDTRGQGASVSPRALILSMRPQGALAGRPVRVFAEIVTQTGFQTVAEAGAVATLADASRFSTVTLPFEKAKLADGADYVLILGLADEDTVSAKDFLFVRGYNWGIGSPNLNDLSWQGAASCAYFSDDPGRLGRALPSADIPFVIEYDAGR